jgi:hypothetical protein
VADPLADLTDAQLRARRDRLTDFLDAWGDLAATDVGAQTSSRLLEFALECPGLALPAEVRAQYREYYRRGPAGDWDLAKYHYEYLDVARSTRLAYHLHDIGPRERVPHAHCEEGTSLPRERPRDDRHQLRAVELDLREAHEEFMRLWAADRAPDCAGFRPLEITRYDRAHRRASDLTRGATPRGGRSWTREDLHDR